MPTVSSDAQYIVYASLSFLFIIFLALIFGVKDYIVNRKVIDYTFKLQAKTTKNMLESLNAMDSLDEHFADNPNAKFYQKTQ